MADDTQVYALDEGGNKIATFSAEQILEAINAAITTGEIPSELTAFIDAIKEQNKGKSLEFWLGTQAEFLALENTEEDIIYFINDSTNLKELSDALDQLKDQLQSGDFVVEKANDVTTSINGKAITSIFETDGTTVKEATNAAKVNSKNLYFHNGWFDMENVEWAGDEYFPRVFYNFVNHTSEAITSADGLRAAIEELFSDVTDTGNSNPFITVTGHDWAVNRGFISIPVYLELQETSSGGYEIKVVIRLISHHGNSSEETIDTIESCLESSCPIYNIHDRVTKIL